MRHILLLLAGLVGPLFPTVSPSAGGPADPPNPSKFAAIQLQDGSVHLSWQPVPRASGYLLIGPGLPKTGVNVMGVFHNVVKVPAGRQRWLVGTVSVDGNTGPRKSFSAVELLVRGSLSGAETRRAR